MSKNKNLTKTKRSKAQQPQQTISPVMIGIVVVGAILLVVGLIVLGNKGGQAASGPADVNAFPTLGDATAPVTLIEYSDYG